MNKYTVKPTSCEITYERYNKKYTTPPVFELYKFNVKLLAVGVLSGLLMIVFFIVYQHVLMADLGLAIAFLFTNVVIRAMYCNGIIDKSVYYQSKLYNFAGLCAYVSQTAVYRIICVSIFVAIKYNFVLNIPFESFLLSAIAGVVLFFISVFSVSGIGSSVRYYTRASQKAYSALLDGPGSMNETVSVIMQSTLDFSILKLNHPELANLKFFHAHEKFLNTANEIKLMTSNYDEQWRRAFLCSTFETSKTFDESPFARRFRNLLEEHKKNAYALNEVIKELNAIEYVEPVIEKKNISVTKPTSKNKKEPIKPKVPMRPAVTAPAKPADVWGRVVNWYD